MKRSVLILILIIAAAGSLFGQSTVSVTADRDTILIGEPVKLVLKAARPRDASPAWFILDTIPHFEILERSKIDTQEAGAGLILEQTVTVTSWDSGKWVVPPLVMGTGQTRPFAINVTYSPMDPAQPYHDIKEIVEAETTDRSNWMWYLIGLATLIVLFLLFFPREKDKALGPAAPPVDVYRESMRRIEALDPQKEAKEFYTELVFVFRYYLEHRKGIQSLSKTTEDLAAQIRRVPLPETQYNSLVGVLQVSDLVKFAKFQTTTADHGEAKNIIRENIVSLEKIR